LRMSLERAVSAPSEPSGGETVVYCTCPDEVSGARVAMTLRQKGIKCDLALAGGIGAWRDLGYPVELAAPGPP
jgi:rhodanese-related sulfurtransferase